MMNYKKYPKYKNSGIPWLGEIPEHWDKQKVMGVTKIYSIKNRPNEELLSVYRDYGVIIKSSRDDNHNKPGLDLTNNKYVYKGALVLNKMKTWQGSLGISKYEGIVSPAYITCKVDFSKVFGDFFNYLLRCNNYIFEYNRLSYGVRPSQWDMRYDDFKNIPVFLPPKPEQTAIANFLDFKLEKIERFLSKKKQLIELLNEQKVAIINQAVTKGLNPNAKMKPSGIEWLGDIPENWEVRKLKFVAKIRNGKDCDKKESGKYPVYGSGGIFGWNDNFIYNKPSVLLGRKGTIDKPQFVENPFWSVDTAFYTEINEKVIIPIFFYFLCSSIIPFEFYSSKTALPSITQTDLYDVKFGIPQKKEQKQIVHHIETETTKIEKTITTIEKEIALVEEYKTALIAEAVTGKIDVRKWSEPLIKND